MKPDNGVETSTSVPLICGEYVFEIYQDTSDLALTSAWITIAETTNTPNLYDFTVDTTVDANLLTSQATQDYTVYIKAYLKDYTNVVTYTSKVV